MSKYLRPLLVLLGVVLGTATIGASVINWYSTTLSDTNFLVMETHVGSLVGVGSYQNDQMWITVDPISGTGQVTTTVTPQYSFDYVKWFNAPSITIVGTDTISYTNLTNIGLAMRPSIVTSQGVSDTASQVRVRVAVKLSNTGQ